MFERLSFIGRSQQTDTVQYVKEIQVQMKKSQMFIKQLENWRNLETNYINRLSDMHNNLVFKGNNMDDILNNQLSSVLGTIAQNHKNLLTNLSEDKFMEKCEQGKKCLMDLKRILDSERKVCAQMVGKRENLGKVLEKKANMIKKIREEQVTEIFLQDSIDMSLDKRLKMMYRMKELQKEKDQYQLKVKECQDIFCQLLSLSKQNQNQCNSILYSLSKHKIDLLLKLQIHGTNLFQSLSHQFQQFMKLCSMNLKPQMPSIQNSYILKEQGYAKKLQTYNIGYIQECLHQINTKQIDKVIEYSKDIAIKKKIRSIIVSSETVPEDTDELTRQVQLTKKILAEHDSASLLVFQSIMKKSFKSRINFIFTLQTYRLSNRFQIKLQELQPMLSMIQSLLTISHQLRDVFVLKQMLILLLTYYVVNKSDEESEKVYLMLFFRNFPMWKDIELWESMLIQCIYIEKNSTVSMILSTSQSNKEELMQAEKTTVLNQILYIVKNMVLFGYQQKEVRQFAVKSTRLLKQDDKFLKDIYKSIKDAYKEEANSTATKRTQSWVEEKSEILV